MLTTQQEHELPRFPFATGPGVSTWRAVTLHVGVIYVVMSYAIWHENGWLPQTSIFWRHNDALSFCKHANIDEKRKLLDIFLLIPVHDGAHVQWSFVPIREVFFRKDGDEDNEFPLYVTPDGKVVDGPGLGGPDNASLVEDCQSFQRIFPA
jgi:hypothetical protein